MKHHYKIINCTHTNGCTTKFNKTGRYVSSTPSGAARKMHTQLCGRKRIQGRCTFRITFVRTDLPLDERKEYVYITRRVKLKTPVKVTIAGKDIVYKYKVDAQKAPKKMPKKCPTTHQQSRGKMLGWKKGGRNGGGEQYTRRTLVRQKGQNLSHALPHSSIRPYLENIHILRTDGGDVNQEFKNLLIEQSLGTTKGSFVRNFNEDMTEILQNDFNVRKSGWPKCSGTKKKIKRFNSLMRDTSKKCFPIVSRYIQQEIHSTAYILRVLAASLISGNETTPALTIKVDNANLTGIWKEDMEHFTLQTFSENREKRKGKLIMGFGPSASGKTYWAKNIIDVLGRLDSTFPSTFLSIDGGIYREQSVIYQLVIRNIKDKTSFDGFRNLVTSNWLRKKTTDGILFDSSVVKKHIKNFLTRPQNPRPNLYVPETLGGCGLAVTERCDKKVQKFIDITNASGDWVGLCIWQHVRNTACTRSAPCCPYPDKYKCVSTTVSGQNREKKEGKKYSPGAWKNSYINGIVESMKAPNQNWYHIHNTGQASATSIIEVSPERASSLRKSRDTVRKIQNAFNCEFRECHLQKNKKTCTSRWDMSNTNPSIIETTSAVL